MGGQNVSESFSYNFREIESINKAKEIAKRNNQSFSELVVEAIKAHVSEKNSEAPRLSILAELPRNIVRGEQYTLNAFMSLSDQELDNMDSRELGKLREKCVEVSVKAAQLRKKRGILR